MDVERVLKIKIWNSLTNAEREGGAERDTEGEREKEK